MEPEKKIEALLELWKETIGVQKHFNDLSLKVRNYLVTILGAIIAAVAYLYKENIVIHFTSFDFNAGAIVLASGFVLLIAIRLMDKLWYHQLLIASVKSGLDLEKLLKEKLEIWDFDLLTTQIKDDSHKVKVWPFFKRDKDNKRWRYAQFSSAKRMNLFYALLFISYSILATSFIVATSVKKGVQPTKIEDKMNLNNSISFKYYDTVCDSTFDEEIRLWVME